MSRLGLPSPSHGFLILVLLFSALAGSAQTATILRRSKLRKGPNRRKRLQPRKTKRATARPACAGSALCTYSKDHLVICGRAFALSI
jgi:hypothetical protein